jgi:hypothetical protein
VLKEVGQAVFFVLEVIKVVQVFVIRLVHQLRQSPAVTLSVNTVLIIQLRNQIIVGKECGVGHKGHQVMQIIQDTDLTIAVHN